MTNAHVIEFADYGEILVNDNWMKCQILTSDADLDLAILQVNDATPFFDMRAATINEQVEHGGDITAIGYPKPDALGYEAKITIGTVSAPILHAGPDQISDASSHYTWKQRRRRV